GGAWGAGNGETVGAPACNRERPMPGPDYPINNLSTCDCLARASDCIARSHESLAIAEAAMRGSDECVGESRLLVAECRLQLQESRKSLGGYGPTWFLDRLP